MKLNQDLLVVVLKVLETTELTTTEEIKLIISALNYLHLMTDYQSWKALQKNISKSSSAELSLDERIYLDELLLKTMLALNRSYLTHLGQHNLLKVLKVDLRPRERKWIDRLITGDDHPLYATTSRIIDHVSCGHVDIQVTLNDQSRVISDWCWSIV